MRQPEPPDTIEFLRDFLQFAVPLRAATLIADYKPKELETLLPGMALRAGISVGHRGDAMTFSQTKRSTRIRTADDFVTGIAAAALLAGPDGVDVFGDHYGPPPGAPRLSSPPAVASDETTPATDLPDIGTYNPAA